MLRAWRRAIRRGGGPYRAAHVGRRGLGLGPLGRRAPPQHVDAPAAPGGRRAARSPATGFQQRPSCVRGVGITRGYQLEHCSANRIHEQQQPHATPLPPVHDSGARRVFRPARGAEWLRDPGGQHTASHAFRSAWAACQAWGAAVSLSSHYQRPRWIGRHGSRRWQACMPVVLPLVAGGANPSALTGDSAGAHARESGGKSAKTLSRPR